MEIHQRLWWWSSKKKWALVLQIAFMISNVSSQLMPPPYTDYIGGGGGGLPEVIRVGGLFDEADPSEETAFKHAVERINSDPTTLPRSRLSTQIERLTPGDSYVASEKVCEMMSGGVAAIFGPQSVEAASHVQSICDAFEIPHIETKWDYKLRKENYLINLAPHPATLSKAYNDLVEAFGWTEYVILYEDNESLFRLQDLIKGSIPQRRNAILRQLPEDDDYRQLLRDILRGTSVRNIIIDCVTEKLPSLLKQAQQVGLMTYDFSYIITSLDFQTLDLEDYKYGDMNMTSFRLIDPEKPEVQAIIRQWNNLALVDTRQTQAQGTRNYDQYLYGSDQSRRAQSNPGSSMTVEENFQMMKTETALIYDAVQLFSKALHVLDSSQRIDIRPLNCESSNTWQHGYSIINYMKMVQLQGLTGLIQFDTSGYRSDVQLDVIQLSSNGLTKIGLWDQKFVSKFNWVKPENDGSIVQNDSMDLKNRTLIITTIKNAPFCMYKKSTTPLSGNDQYEGYSIDLTKAIADILGFKYQIRIVADGAYGSLQRNGEWNGMIKEILDGEADLAIADLTVNKVRQEAVAFTMPFMNLGISILFTKPKAKPPSLYSFLSPFSLDVWLYMCFAFVSVSLILFIIARITPYEWDCPHPCIEDPDELENQFTLLNAFWFTIGSLMQQGSDVAPKITPYEWVANRCNRESSEVIYINELSLLNTMWFLMAGLFRQKASVYPKATSTRMIAGIWWFFTLIMVSSYTANLATFLIVQDLEESIKGLSDLPIQDKVKYGCVATGSTAAFFRDSEFAEKKLIWQKMTEMKPSPFVASNAEGVNRVKDEDGKYAFFVESTVLEYNTERICSLTQVGQLLDSKGYAIALPKNSKYRQAFSSAVLTLQGGGVLDALKRKWWKEERKETQCDAAGASGEVKPLGLSNVGGVFVVLVLGCLIAIKFAFLEFYYKTRSNAKSAGENVKEALSQELKFALAFSGDTKPVNSKKKDSLTNETMNETMGSNSFLDLGLDSYGFPKPVNRSNGGIPPDGFT